MVFRNDGGFHDLSAAAGGGVNGRNTLPLVVGGRGVGGRDGVLALRGELGVVARRGGVGGERGGHLIGGRGPTAPLAVGRLIRAGTACLQTIKDLYNDCIIRQL